MIRVLESYTLISRCALHPMNRQELAYNLNWRLRDTSSTGGARDIISKVINLGVLVCLHSQDYRPNEVTLLYVHSIGSLAKEIWYSRSGLTKCHPYQLANADRMKCNISSASSRPLISDFYQGGYAAIS